MRISRWIRKTPFARLLKGTPPRTLFTIAVLSILGGACEALLLILIVRVGTLAVGGKVTGVLGTLPVVSSGIGATIVTGIVVGVMTIILQAGAVWVSLREANRRSIRLRQSLLHRFLFTSLEGQNSQSPGEMQELASQGVTRAGDGFIIAANMGTNAFNLVMLAVAAFVVSPIASLSLVVLGALLALFFLPFSRMSMRSNKAWVHTNTAFASFMSVFTKMGVEAKVFGVRAEVEAAAARRIEDIGGSWFRSRLMLRGSPVVVRISILVIAFAALGLVLLVVPTAVGTVAVIALLLVRALSYIQGIQSDSQTVQEQAVHAEDLVARLQSFPPDDVVWGSGRLTRIDEISLQGVAYSYDGVHDHVKSTDFQARRGELITITGASGEGKSTFLKILLRLVEPQRGDFVVNGAPIETIIEADWFAHVAYLPQEVRLIPGTVADNVRFFRTATDDDVNAAIQMAALVLDMASFPSGIETRIRDQGSNLSGGQRQRIGLARALLTNPDLLVLDEPTSALDPGTERGVVETIRSLRNGMIAVLVTHQPAVADEADRSYTMRQGRLGAVQVEPID